MSWDESRTVAEPSKPGNPVLAVIVGMVVVILGGLLIWALLHIRHLDGVLHKDAAKLESQRATISHFQTENELRGSALQAGEQYGVWLSSYNYHDLTSSSSDWSQVEAHADPKFQHDFATSDASLTPEITRYHAVASGDVLSEGIVTINDSQAQLDIFIDQTVTNTVQTPNSVTQPLRVELTLVRQGGQWLIDALQIPK